MLASETIGPAMREACRWANDAGRHLVALLASPKATTYLQDSGNIDYST